MQIVVLMLGARGEWKQFRVTSQEGAHTSFWLVCAEATSFATLMTNTTKRNNILRKTNRKSSLRATGHDVEDTNN